MPYVVNQYTGLRLPMKGGRFPGHVGSPFLHRRVPARHDLGRLAQQPRRQRELAGARIDPAAHHDAQLPARGQRFDVGVGRRRVSKGQQGLSPRVRGNPTPRARTAAACRSIPASAGEPRSPRPSSTAPRVYPRECGGTSGSAGLFVRPAGLSPRVRGNRARTTSNAFSPGSIPASAGEPPRLAAVVSWLRVYPRECGGTPPPGPPPSPFLGLSPRVRGTPRGPPGADGVTGLSPRVRGNRRGQESLYASPGSIPASAGEPPAGRARAPPPRVYPRECGGTTPPPTRIEPLRGLSPRVRGNRSPSRCSVAASGSIPASAGEPRSAYLAQPASRVYPRECGGTVDVQQVGFLSAGLSPRVRGNRAPQMRQRLVVGSIPASAGEPGGHRSPRRHARVYPRECGGTQQVAFVERLATGLSPRVRGNRRRARASGRADGSIPASAGEPRPPNAPLPTQWVYPRECGGTRQSAA